jgi:hypothetical protein
MQKREKIVFFNKNANLSADNWRKEPEITIVTWLRFLERVAGADVLCGLQRDTFCVHKEPILRLLNLQLQRQRFGRLERFSK